MNQLVDRVIETITKAGLVEVEVSARHIHLTDEDVEILFGKGSILHEKRPLSQKGQYLCEERVNLIGPKGRKERVAILGPPRPASQAELSISDCITLGVRAPLRESGKLDGAEPIIIEGPCGKLKLHNAAIVARNHIHVTPDIAGRLGVKDEELVNVQIISGRPLIFENVIIRINEKFRFRMHIDQDEANAAMVRGFTLGRIIRKNQPY